MAQIQFTNSFMVDAPIEKAFALMADVEKHPQIFSINKGVRNYHGGPLKEGDTWQSVGQFLGQETVTTYTLEAFSEPNLLHFRTESSSGDGYIIWRFSEKEEGTFVQQEAAGEPKGFFASVAAPLLKGSLQKQIVQDGENFKMLVEAS